MSNGLPFDFDSLTWLLPGTLVDHQTNQDDRPHRRDSFPSSTPAPKPSSRHLHAGRPPGQECRTPPDSSQGNNWTLVSAIIATLTTLHQWFTRVRLLGSHLTPHGCLFRKLPTTALYRSRSRWFVTSPCVGGLGGPTSITSAAPHQDSPSSTSEPPSALSAHHRRRTGNNAAADNPDRADPCSARTGDAGVVPAPSPDPH